jgi:hypothetical protein
MEGNKKRRKADMKRIYFLVMFIAFVYILPSFVEAIDVWKQRDWQCYNDCIDLGYSRSYCDRACSYINELDWFKYKTKNWIKIKVDRQCYNDCLDLGYKRSYCEQACSYIDEW